MKSAPSGAPAQLRRECFLDQRQPANPVVITGDIHSSWVHDLKADFSNPDSRTVGTEFVGTSITSDFPAQFIAPVTAALTDNPHTKFFDGAFRGYVRCNLTRDRASDGLPGGIDHPRPERRHQHPSFVCSRRRATGRTACLGRSQGGLSSLSRVLLSRALVSVLAAAIAPFCHRQINNASANSYQQAKGS